MSNPPIPAPAVPVLSFDDFMARAWDEHAGQPAAVAERLSGAGESLVSTAGELTQLVGLLHHVHGTHLGTWDAGRQALQALRAHPHGTGPALEAIARAQATLALCRGDADALDGAGASETIRITAMAAAHLAERDTPRAMALWQEALAGCARLQTAPGDPCHRALAVTGNNLASTLEEKADLSEAERQLMIEAAQAARVHWALAGTWLEVERAEFRLAMSWLKAGDPARARQHAQACMDIVLEQGAPALERFFAAFAVSRAAGVGGDAAARLAARDQAEQAFGELSATDQGWCRASLEALTA